jgi:hypothetical protein
VAVLPDKPTTVPVLEWVTLPQPYRGDDTEALTRTTLPTCTLQADDPSLGKQLRTPPAKARSYMPSAPTR